ncbi:hypothetical protein IX51_09170 [uncultured archaeon]|nr:hypothetical protein IX51_09170 [uncultured archaeon]
MNDLLSIRGLETVFDTKRGTVKALRSLDLDIHKGETLALVGESGSGKSTLGLSIMRLIESPGRIAEGSIILHATEDVDVTSLKGGKLRRFRWKKVAMVFQSAMNVLNPVMRIEDQFIDALEAHDIDKSEISGRIDHYLKLAGLGPKVRRLYPHELSGGMRQRVNIALALSCEPDLLIADEPTTALDVVVQKEILKSLNTLKKQLGLTIIFITHDISVAASVADRMAIFYAGRIVEIGPKEEVINRPRHPYSKALLSSIITLNTKRGQDLISLKGNPPDLITPIEGCSFHNRCPSARPECLKYKPVESLVSSDHYVECLYPIGE